MKRNLLKFRHAAVLLLLAAAACKKNDRAAENTTPGNTPATPATEALTIPADWPRDPTLNTGLPASIAIHRKTTTLNGSAFRGYMAIVNMQDANLVFKPALRSSLSTPSTFYNAEAGTKYITVNGGFFDFGSGQSLSLVLQNNSRLANNTGSIVRSGRTYFPTRAAFGFNSSNRGFSASWVYTLTDGRLFNYPSPSPNNELNTPQPRPSATFPSGGNVWGVTDAMGGSPMLVTNGTRNITDVAELASFGTNSKNARTAYGYTSDGRMLILVAERSGVSSGASLVEMANIMVSFGASRAVNFDGSGSSCMLVNGKQSIAPSDGSQRAVAACLFIKAK